jgi:D-xylose transport system substrate-binding protein
MTGDQCGTVYKPIDPEAQAAAAVALYLRANQTPPASLVTRQTEDSTTKKQVPSVYLTPTWVTGANMEATVVKDNFVKASDICISAVASACTAAGIK